MLPLLLLTLAQASLPAGELIPDVKCEADPSQSYALYLPKGYDPARAYPVIFAFDPGARGRMPVERYQAAAEQYGYIVAGSNNSRNGSPQTGPAVVAMSSDVLKRFHVDPNRVYVAGMSGGARVAFEVALKNPTQIAGVLASSAGFPDAEPRKTVPFPIFATAGTEDFNHLEMRRLDAPLTSPHRLVIFEGSHVWLSSELAMQAVEWMEIQAMKSGREPKEQARVDAIFSKRTAALESVKTDKERYTELLSLAADFSGLKDVSSFTAQADALGRSKDVKNALARDRDEDDREMRTLQDMTRLAARLTSTDDRMDTLNELRGRWRQLSDAAKKPADSSERRLARRIIALLAQSSTTSNPQYRKIIEEYRRF